MPHVFISYKSEDSEFAFEVDRTIREAGFETWIDQVKLVGGDDWREEIDEALRNSFALVLVVSPRAMNSMYMGYEMAFAWALDLRIVPITIDGADHESFHPRLKGRQKRNFGSTRPWNDLLEDLARARAGARGSQYAIPRDTPPAVVNAANELSSTDKGKRTIAIRALMENIHPSAKQILLNHLTDHQRAVRFEVAFELAKLQEIQAIGPIIEALYCGEMEWQLKAIDAMEMMGPMLIDAFHDALKHESVDIRFDAARTLGQAGFLQRKSISYLITSLNDEEPKVRRAAALSLGEYGRLAPVERLIEALADPDANVRAIVAEALGKSKSPDAIQPLANILKPDPKTKRYTNEITAAVTALRRIGTAEALSLVEPYKEHKTYWEELWDMY